MKYTILRKTKYKDVFVYITQFSNIFQYLFSWDGEIFENKITLKPSIWRRIAYVLRLSSIYTPKQVGEGEKIILSGAIRSIDAIIAKGPNNRAENRRIQKAKNKDCVWQTRVIEVQDGKNIKEEGHYLCLEHGIVVKMEEGVKPNH